MSPWWQAPMPVVLSISCAGQESLALQRMSSASYGLISAAVRYGFAVFSMTTRDRRCWRFGNDNVANSSAPQPWARRGSTPQPSAFTPGTR